MGIAFSFLISLQLGEKLPLFAIVWWYTIWLASP